MQPTPSTPGSTPSSTLLTDLRAEVGAESAPLLQFILRHAGLIACGVGLFVLVLVGAGIWSWRSDVAKEEAQAELARLSLTLKGEERTKALGELAARVPSDMRFAVLSAQAQSAAESQDWAQAARIYGEAARLDSEGSLGLAALFAQCGALMNAGTPESASEALAVLQALTGRVGAAEKDVLLRRRKPPRLPAVPMWPRPLSMSWPRAGTRTTRPITATVPPRCAVRMPPPRKRRRTRSRIPECAARENGKPSQAMRRTIAGNAATACRKAGPPAGTPYGKPAPRRAGRRVPAPDASISDIIFKERP